MKIEYIHDQAEDNPTPDNCRSIIVTQKMTLEEFKKKFPNYEPESLL